MIRAIVAIDDKRGIANEQGIPWDLPTDIAYFREKTEHGIVLMGLGVYNEFAQPLENRENVVAALEPQDLRPGFQLVTDARKFLNENAHKNPWIIGGAMVYEATIDLADELYITKLEGDYGCTKFFPDYHNDFKLVKEDSPITENGITFRFQIWQRTQK